eukprot:CAMPEP_0171087602 /NCGR_PEP_ID=MMETSP0766_2-20121228/20257_1 /TAXON_ID=439317 /ORGANISM="Gambierdiscus australes, Strain CAWD 149" /LENGTH=84 /DNA_ID=CAMNT_0011545321 /DNA_START=523 /DNA_END=777 /DNA_ORIENTATION=-
MGTQAVAMFEGKACEPKATEDQNHQCLQVHRVPGRPLTASCMASTSLCRRCAPAYAPVSEEVQSCRGMWHGKPSRHGVRLPINP